MNLQTQNKIINDWAYCYSSGKTRYKRGLELSAQDYQNHQNVTSYQPVIVSYLSC